MSYKYCFREGIIIISTKPTYILYQTGLTGLTGYNKKIDYDFLYSRSTWL